mgnify:FL=1
MYNNFCSRFPAYKDSKFNLQSIWMFRFFQPISMWLVECDWLSQWKCQMCLSDMVDVRRQFSTKSLLQGNKASSSISASSTKTIDWKLSCVFSWKKRFVALLVLIIANRLSSAARHWVLFVRTLNCLNQV